MSSEPSAPSDDSKVAVPSRRTPSRPVLPLVVWGLVGFAFAWAAWLRFEPSRSGADSVVQKVSTASVFGTRCRLIAVGDPDQIEAIFQAVLREFARIDAAVSTYRTDSELSDFNTAVAQVDVEVSPTTSHLLQSARNLFKRSAGAFDPTSVAFSEAWDAAARSDRLPSQSELSQARALVGMDKVSIGNATVRKRVAGLKISLDAIAKGYAVHRAIELMTSAGLTGGLVDIGGDIECYGTPLDSENWHVGIQDPWLIGPPIALVSARDAGSTAVCTSGNYRRFKVIEGQRFSHIIDPRTGYPADRWSSVTVIAGDATSADGWATALSVLGPDPGLELIAGQPGIEALFLSGDPDHPEVRCSAGFPRYISSSELEFNNAR